MLSAILLALVTAQPVIAARHAPPPTCADLPTARDPRSLGWDMTRLEAARARAREGGAASFMIMTHGQIVVADGDVARPLIIASVRKSIMSAMYGQIVAEGKIALTDPVSKFGINEDVPLTPAEQAATIGDLITARSGVYLPTAAETAAMKARRPARGSHPPGTYWYYNNWDFNVLGDIYERVTAKSVYTAFQRRIAEPLCMQDFDAYDNGFYSYDPGAPRFPAYHLALSARDLLRFGQLYLDHGRYGGRQIVPQAWVEASVKPVSHTGADVAIASGYGYLWWVTTDAVPQPGAAPRVPVGSFMASGAGGQEMIVIPAIDSIILTRADHLGGHPSKFTQADQWQELVRLTLAARTVAGQ